MGTPEKVSEFLAASPLPLWIDGEPRAARSGSEVSVLSPSTGLQVATAACAQADDVADAVEAASAAFDSWSRLPGVERSAYLVRLADLMDEHADVLAALETLDVGKPLRDSIGFDVPFAINSYRYFADVAAHESDRALEIAGLEAARHGIARGVCALIYPWNAPFLLSSWSIAPALAAGNTVVLKPSELTPLTSLYIARLAAQAGLPAGVLNVIPGAGADCGEALVHHRDVAMISFTGSPETGRRIAAAAAENFIPTKLELGGKGAAVVFDDVDVDATAASLVGALTLNAGQVCCTATRWIVHETVFDHLVDAAADRLQLMTIGPGYDETSEIGPLITETARQRVLGLMQAGEAEGAHFLLKGGQHTVEGAEGGFFVAPSLMSGPADNICAQQEIFGPTAYLVPFRTPEEAVGLANNTRYGLANSVWSADLGRAGDIARQLRSGSTWINAHNVFAYGLPYGGIRMSGWGGGVNSGTTYDDYQHTVTVARPLSG